MERFLEHYLDEFLGNDDMAELSNNETERKVCDSQTGECFVIKTKDGIVERINKRFITEDGRQLLQD